MKKEFDFDDWFDKNLKSIPSFEDLIPLWIDYPCLSNEDEENYEDE